MKALLAASAVAAVMMAMVPTTASAWWHRPYGYGWRMHRWGYRRPRAFWAGGWGGGFGGGTYGGYNFTGGAQTMTGGPSGGTGS